jgi:glycosyltransferase involved in cell wall biosynthesis
LTVGYFSPLPPAQSGVADYAAALLPALRRFGRVEVAPSNYDIGLYQLGNNQLHREVYAAALARPGVIVLHDAVLHHFFLGSLNEAAYIDEFVFNYGEWSRSEAQSLWNARSASSQDPRYFARPMLRRVAETSLAVIVHNPAAAAIVSAHAPNARIFEIPLFFQRPAPADPVSVIEFRRPFQYLFGIFGYLRESKRLIPTLKAFARLRRICPWVGLLVAGEIHSSDLARAAKPWLADPGVRRLGHMTEAEFAIASEAADCCINLRYPSAGETSAIAARLMGLGKPVILTEGFENSSYPAGSFLSVMAGAGEEEHLFQAMAALAGNPAIGKEAGMQAAKHLVRYHSLEESAGKYWSVLCDHSRLSAPSA